MKATYSSVVLVLFFLLSIQTASAQPVCAAGACFGKQKEVEGQKLSLRGVSLFEYLMFDVYTGAFYAQTDVDTVEEALSDSPKLLVLQYHRSLERQNFIDNSEHILKQNPAVDMNALRPQIQQLYKLYTDVSKGDRYALQYIPGKGTTLYLNGVAQGTIPGADFQKAYFAIWISNHSVDDDFTNELLGN